MRVQNAIEVRCPACGAHPGEPCKTFGSGHRSHARVAGPHTDRFDKACDHPLSRLLRVDGNSLVCGCGRTFKLKSSNADSFRILLAERGGAH